jgi:hypothetical protein
LAVYFTALVESMLLERAYTLVPPQSELEAMCVVVAAISLRLMPSLLGGYVAARSAGAWHVRHGIVVGILGPLHQMLPFTQVGLLPVGLTGPLTARQASANIAIFWFLAMLMSSWGGYAASSKTDNAARLWLQLLSIPAGVLIFVILLLTIVKLVS